MAQGVFRVMAGVSRGAKNLLLAREPAHLQIFVSAGRGIPWPGISPRRRCRAFKFFARLDLAVALLRDETSAFHGRRLFICSVTLRLAQNRDR